MNSASRDVTYVCDKSKLGGQVFEVVGGRLILMKDGSRWEEYDSRAWTSSRPCQYLLWTSHDCIRTLDLLKPLTVSLADIVVSLFQTLKTAIQRIRHS